MRKFLLLVALIANSTCSMAQLSGIVTCNNDRVSAATIKDLSIRRQALSDERGQFVLKTRPGDTLTIDKDGFVKDTVLVTDQTSVIIELHKPIRLKGVVISDKALLPEAVYSANRKYYKLIYFWGDNKGIIMPGSFMNAGVTVNIDKLNNALGKRGRRARHLQRTFTSDYKNSVVDHRFDTLAASITGYKGKQLDDFIEHNRLAYEEIVKLSDYDIIKYIRKKMAETKKTGLIKLDFNLTC